MEQCASLNHITLKTLLSSKGSLIPRRSVEHTSHKLGSKMAFSVLTVVQKGNSVISKQKTLSNALSAEKRFHPHTEPYSKIATWTSEFGSKQ